MMVAYDKISSSDYLTKLKLCFEMCKKFGINFNLEKCVFMVFFKMIMGLIMFKESKLLDTKEIEIIVNMLVPTNPQLN